MVKKKLLMCDIFSCIGEIIISIPIYFCLGLCEIGTCVRNQCKECGDIIEQTIADSESSCCSYSRPADLNSRIQKVYLPEHTKRDSLREEIGDMNKY